MMLMIMLMVMMIMDDDDDQSVYDGRLQVLLLKTMLTC